MTPELHDADQGAVAQADEGRGVDSVEEPGLVGGEARGSCRA
jgi:hypothetical protein